MLRPLIAVFVLVTALAACAHHGAVRVQCDGALRPINSPPKEGPVSLVPSQAPESDNRE